jgi:hypothetical protein
MRFRLFSQAEKAGVHIGGLRTTKNRPKLSQGAVTGGDVLGGVLLDFLDGKQDGISSNVKTLILQFAPEDFETGQSFLCGDDGHAATSFLLSHASNS